MLKSLFSKKKYQKANIRKIVFSIIDQNFEKLHLFSHNYMKIYYGKEQFFRLFISYDIKRTKWRDCAIDFDFHNDRGKIFNECDEQ